MALGTSPFGTSALGNRAVGAHYPLDETPPRVTNFQPARGADITADTTLQFDIVDERIPGRGFALVEIAVVGPLGADQPEVAYTRGVFRGAYVNAQSTVRAIKNGFRFTLRRTGGWRDANGNAVAPTIEYITVDKSGNLGEVG